MCVCVCDVHNLFTTYNSSIAMKNSNEKNEILAGKEQVIKAYMFEPNNGSQCKASDDSGKDSGSEKKEFDEELETANAWHCTSLQLCKFNNGEDH